jgi:hypothetical protein
MNMGKRKDDKNRAAQLYGRNRTIDVSNKRSVEVIEFEVIRRNTELDRLRSELDEICKDTEKIFEASKNNVTASLQKSATQVMRDYFHAFRRTKL